MSLGGRPPVDSRRWTGPGPEEPPLDRRAARVAFRAAGGAGAAAPQRAASAVSWAGLALLPPVVLAGAAPGASLLGLGPGAVRLRGGLEALLAPGLGLKGAEGMAGLLGDPRLLAALLALGGGALGVAMAWRHRAALARGFAAAEAGVPGAAFRTRRHGEAAPFVLLVLAWPPPGGGPLPLQALAFWFLARLAAGSLTALAERRAAGLGARSATPSGWDLATLLLSAGALLLLLARVLGVVG